MYRSREATMTAEAATTATDRPGLSPGARPPVEPIGVWLAWPDERDPVPWEGLLADAARDLRGGLRYLGRICPAGEALAALREDAGQVFVTSPGDHLAALFAAGKGVVLVGGPPECAGFAGCGPLAFVAPGVAADGLAAAVLTAASAARREAGLKRECVQLDRRLRDRILLERAKGILVQRLGLAEGEAYRRLRSVARGRRRSLGDLARSLLDAGGLLDPDLAREIAAGEGAR